MLADEVATFTRNDKALNEPEFNRRQLLNCRSECHIEKLYRISPLSLYPAFVLHHAAQPNARQLHRYPLRQKPFFLSCCCPDPLLRTLAKDLVTALSNESLNNSTHVMKHEAHGRNAAAETYQSDRRGCEHRVTKRFVRAAD